MSLEIKENSKVYRLNEEFIITKVIDFNYVFAKNTLTFETTRLSIKDLSSKPISNTETKLCEDLSQIPEKKLLEAKKRYEAIKPIIGLNSRKEVEKRAKELYISPTTLYNWLRAYESTGQLSSLASLKIKGGKDKSRLTKEQDELIDLVLEEYYLTKLKPTVQRAYELVAIKCNNTNIKKPSISSVRRRANSLSEKLILKRREGKKSIEQFEFNKGEYPDGLYPLHVLQIDHTKADIILVDNEHRHELGRPWITMAIDIYSRMVAGFYVSFEAPGYFATGQTLLNSILPKDKLKEQYNFKSDYPLWGIPNMIHMDNAKEFRGIDLQHVCDEYGINIVWRPVGKARFGGHIERLLGTLSKYIHTLEGTTFSNISQRKNYDSQKEAMMTLSEFEEWLTILITDVYHKKNHSQINMTPLQKYEEGIFGTKNQPPRGLPKKIEDEQFLYINLLPREDRTIQKTGIQIDNITYYSEVLNAWIDAFDIIRGKKIKKKFVIRRDPRDISHIWFFDPRAKTYYQIPYRNSRLPKVSIWEYKTAQKYLKNELNKEYKEEEVFEALERLRNIASNSKKKTKTQRKHMERINSTKYIPIESTNSNSIKLNNQSNIQNLDDSWFESNDIKPFNGIGDESLTISTEEENKSTSKNTTPDDEFIF
jgi:putative transposase